MLFNSIEYLVFLPAVVCLHFAVGHRWRWLVLLGASYVFYMWWQPAYALLMAAVTLAGYGAALGVERWRGTWRGRMALWIGVGLSVGLLVYFKYAGFAARSLNRLASVCDAPWRLSPVDILLPVGISFFTFQVLAYMVDVHRGVLRAERHAGYFALFVSFFPQLVAGPIERTGNLLPQLRAPRSCSADAVGEGLKRIAWGLFKKVVVADRLALYVNEVYGQVGSQSGATLAMATVFFAFQIYCDFSAYSDIAVGSARLLGVRLMRNFDNPYLASSVAEFWRRWHISLSTWFRDYVYEPLGGRRLGPRRQAGNLLATFAISGLWHGASWTFVLWGVYHGALMAVYRLSLPVRERIAAVAGRGLRGRAAHTGAVVVTFLVVTAGWTLFRSRSVHLAAVSWKRMLTLSDGPVPWDVPGFAGPEFWLAAAFAAAVQATEWGIRRRGWAEWFGAQRWVVRMLAYQVLAATILLFGVFEKTAFVYFRF